MLRNIFYKGLQLSHKGKINKWLTFYGYPLNDNFVMASRSMLGIESRIRNRLFGQPYVKRGDVLSRTTSLEQAKSSMIMIRSVLPDKVGVHVLSGASSRNVVSFSASGFFTRFLSLQPKEKAIWLMDASQVPLYADGIEDRICYVNKDESVSYKPNKIYLNKNGNNLDVVYLDPIDGTEKHAELTGDQLRSSSSSDLHDLCKRMKEQMTDLEKYQIRMSIYLHSGVGYLSACITKAVEEIKGYESIRSMQGKIEEEQYKNWLKAERVLENGCETVIKEFGHSVIKSLPPNVFIGYQPTIAGISVPRFVASEFYVDPKVMGYKYPSLLDAYKTQWRSIIEAANWEKGELDLSQMDKIELIEVTKKFYSDVNELIKAANQETAEKPSPIGLYNVKEIEKAMLELLGTIEHSRQYKGMR